MSSNRTKYSEEMREQTTIFILESGKSATSVAEEMGIDVNTVCRWVRDYRRKHKRSLRDMNEQYKSQYSMILYKNYIDILQYIEKQKGLMLG